MKRHILLISIIFVTGLLGFFLDWMDNNEGEADPVYYQVPYPDPTEQPTRIRPTRTAEPYPIPIPTRIFPTRTKRPLPTPVPTETTLP